MPSIPSKTIRSAVISPPVDKSKVGWIFSRGYRDYFFLLILEGQFPCYSAPRSSFHDLLNIIQIELNENISEVMSTN